jgi:hypothetical protein
MRDPRRSISISISIATSDDECSCSFCVCVCLLAMHHSSSSAAARQSRFFSGLVLLSAPRFFGGTLVVQVQPSGHSVYSKTPCISRN